MNSKDNFTLSRNKFLDDYKSFMVLKNFSPRTIKTYVSILDYFFRYCELHFPEVELNDDLVRKYLLHRFEAGCSWQTVNSDYSAIQKFFKNLVFLDWSLKKLPRPRKEKPLPTIFSKEDIVKIIESATTFKQQILLTFIYVTGTRLSEAVNLKIDDIDGSRYQIRINGGKGAKDRLILVPAQFINTLRVYYKKVKPEIYLFNGATKGLPYAPRTLQYTLQQAKRRA